MFIGCMDSVACLLLNLLHNYDSLFVKDRTLSIRAKIGTCLTMKLTNDVAQPSSWWK